MTTQVSLIAAGSLLLVGLAQGQTPLATPSSEIPAILTPVREQVGERPEVAEPRERDEIETDRDSFTPSTKTVGRRRLVIESAYSFLENRGRAETHSFPELLARYGLTERIELRLGWNYEVGGAANTVSGGGEGGESFDRRLERENNINLGVKVRVTEQSRWVPESSVILAGLIPTGGPESTPLFAGTYVFGWELPNRWKFDAAMRYATDVAESDHFADWAPSVVVKMPIGEKWAAHAEYFGTFTTGKEHDDVRHYFSPGVHYLITPEFEVGTRLGWGLNDQSSRFFCNVGLGCRF